MTRKLLICLGAAVALLATSGEVRAAPLCEPEQRPEVCLPGISTSPECQMRDPAREPDAGGSLDLKAPEPIATAEIREPAPPARRSGFAAVAIGSVRPGFARGIDRPPKRPS